MIGLGNADNSVTPGEEPGNQLASVDFRYAGSFGLYDFAFYGELLGEDEDNIVIDKFAVMTGIWLGGSDSAELFAWTLSSELSDTEANRVIGKGIFFSTIYNHFRHIDGYRN